MIIKGLDKNSIVNELYRNEDASQSQYLIKNFFQIKLWKELDEETIVNFLKWTRFLLFKLMKHISLFFLLVLDMDLKNLRTMNN